MSGATVLTRSQFDSLRAKVAPPEPTQAENERQRLRELSQQRAASWPNTLEAQRAQKERARQEWLAEQETKRVAQDERTATIRAEQRRHQIEAANKMLWDDTDRVKALHSRLLLSDILSVRKRQVAERERRSELEQKREAAFVERQAAALREAEEAEKRKAEAVKARAMEQKAVQTRQLEALKARILEERALDRAEGDMIRQKALEEAEDLRRKEEEVRAKAKNADLQTKLANETLQAFKLKELERERAADQAIEEYARRKAAVAEERRRRDEERAAAKEARRRRMVDIMEENYLKWVNKTEDALQRDVKAAEEKQDNEAAERARIRKEEWDSIHRSRQGQLQRKREAKADAAAADREFAQAWARRLLELKQEEADEARVRREKAQAHVAFLQRQEAAKVARQAQVRDEDRYEDALRHFNLEEDLDTFLEYAKVCRDEWASQGKSTVPIDKYLHAVATNTNSVTKRS